MGICIEEKILQNGVSCFYEKYTGEISFEEVVKSVVSALHIKDCETCNIITDWGDAGRACLLAIDWTEFAALVDSVETGNVQYNNAIIVGKDAELMGLAESIKSMTKNSNVIFNVVGDEQEAIEWLEGCQAKQ
ncbi:hypothetical protein [Terasakiella sp. SH-1]|uniref:hypothetical protein n=1 Tax=Terasakiella sp. SH-1 TaxID=2560057 RepID=UPI0010749825|nr:hypothetical protein [Terasakiella sp. SH-1]